MKLPRPESTEGVWTRGYMSEGGFFGFRPNLWVVWVRAPAMLGIASPAPFGSKAPQHRLQATSHTEIPQTITLTESYLLWTLVIIGYCPQGRMCFFVREEVCSNKQNKTSWKGTFIPFERQLQGRAEGRLGLIWAR